MDKGFIEPAFTNNNAWWQYRNYLKKTYFTDKETHQIPLRSPETHLLDDDWERLVLYWSGTKNVDPIETPMAQQNADRILGKSALLSNGKGSNGDKVQDSDTSLLVSNKADKTAKEDYLEDSETTPKSCLGLVFELLATTACTSYSNSLSESVWFLESQLQVERHRSAVLRQEAEGLRKSLEHSDAYFLVQQQALEDFSAKQDKANKLAKLIASMVDTQDNVS
ncbi:uncharacterized protein [Aegilops tauschii subsp. strangulata]|uniref:uncharacterized protein isoform X2 n=1 Tax=Aegilops tauschii subsp. strangulata TaxID=200361 RepID=UPI003CC8D12A